MSTRRTAGRLLVVALWICGSFESGGRDRIMLGGMQWDQEISERVVKMAGGRAGRINLVWNNSVSVYECEINVGSPEGYGDYFDIFLTPDGFIVNGKALSLDAALDEARSHAVIAALFNDPAIICLSIREGTDSESLRLLLEALNKSRNDYSVWLVSTLPRQISSNKINWENLDFKWHKEIESYKSGDFDKFALDKFMFLTSGLETYDLRTSLDYLSQDRAADFSTYFPQLLVMRSAESDDSALLQMVLERYPPTEVGGRNLLEFLSAYQEGRLLYLLRAAYRNSRYHSAKDVIASELFKLDEIEESAILNKMSMSIEEMIQELRGGDSRP